MPVTYDRLGEQIANIKEVREGRFAAGMESG